MGQIGSISVSVVANTEKFSKGMKSARKELSSFEKTANSFMAGMKSFGISLASTFAAGFSVSEIRNTISALDDLGDAAKNLGTTAKSLGGLQHAGIMADVAPDELISNLTRMEKNLVTNAKAFDKMGMSVAHLKQMDATEAFIQIADAINRMPTAAERTAAAMEVFGKSGAKMLELIGRGPDGIRSAMSEAESMGLAPSDETIKQIEKAENAIKRLSESYRGLKLSAAGGAPGGLLGRAAEGASFVMSNVAPGQASFDRVVNSMERGRFSEYTRRLSDIHKQRNTGDLKRSLNQEFFGSDTLDYQMRRAIEARLRREAGMASGLEHGFAGGTSANLLDRRKTLAGGGGFSPFMGLGGLAAQWQGQWAADKIENSRSGLDMATLARIESAMSQAALDTRFSEAAGKGRRIERLRGFESVEYGSAAAFSQERRSRMESKFGDTAKEQLKEDKAAVKLLQSIDKNLKATNQVVPTVNIA